MAGYNRVIMVGNLTRDPELRQLPSGASVCRLNIASNRQFRDKTGNLTQEVCFIDIDVWGPQADTCKQYLQKGRSILVEGRLKLDSWKDNDGQNRSKHSIVANTVQFLSSATEQGVTSETANSEVSAFDEPTVATAPKATRKSSTKKVLEPSFDDELPF
ncbi:MAG: single-stranded DNA-binding protein [Candidatus Babeliaceae bacterium]|nr:single-stranded DNA-binding protein [Candidatus Babeliaceae bacterium]